MIFITDKHNCCGCSACVQICPKQCISFNEDAHGFLYPIAEKAFCIDCRLCERVCPSLNQNKTKEPLKVYAAINPNEEIRMKSSSGGVFSILAENVINDGGVVFGARFDEHWEVMHDYTETKEGLDAFRGSKYLQSRIGKTYWQAREFLLKGRKVLYSGTGCQVAGLKKFLQQEYDNLLTVEVVCHSVPSPLIWRHYLKEQTEGHIIKSVNFRDKISGWSHYGYSLVVKTDFSTYMESSFGSYMKGITTNLTTRPSCSQCPSRHGKSGADLMIADCWGIWDIMPEIDDNKGVSTVEVLSGKGMDVLNSLDIKLFETSIDVLLKYNGGLNEPHPDNPYTEDVFNNIGHETLKEIIEKYMVTSNPSILSRLKMGLLKWPNSIMEHIMYKV